MQGIVTKAVGGTFVVYSDNHFYNTKPKGILKHNNIEIRVGDKVSFKDNIIYEVHERVNVLKRPIIANVSLVLIVLSVKHPTINYLLLDRLLSTFEYHKIPCSILFTKLDLATIPELEQLNKIKSYYNSIGYLTFTKTLDKICEVELDKTGITLVTGESGVGKSTFLNLLNKDLNLKTDNISISLGRGKNTTRHIELFKHNDGFIADSPGYSNLSLDYIENLSSCFREFNECFCEYSDCMHINELNCGVKDKVNEGKILKSRYQNYLKILDEFDKLKPYLKRK